MRRRLALAGIVSALLVCAPGRAQGQDPRTAAGQLAACGGMAAWQQLGYLEFEVKIGSPQGVKGPWHYRWDRRNGYMRLTGPGPDGATVDVALEVRSRTGGGTRNGKQLSGQELSNAVTWTLQRFGEDVLWLTFPLEWSAPGVTVTPQPDVTGADGKTHPATKVDAPTGVWDVQLDPSTGLVQRTVFERPGAGKLTVTWDQWQPHDGVYFAHRRRITETGEDVEVSVLKAQADAPPDAF